MNPIPRYRSPGKSARSTAISQQISRSYSSRLLSVLFWNLSITARSVWCA